MTTNEKIVALARIVRGIIEGTHAAAPDHCKCPLVNTSACAFSGHGALARLDEITGDVFFDEGVRHG